ncbi:hypothetical protein ABZ330_10595 [Streptomyces sp. NPDC006172]|uniref:hypothetical protein n=1 Tax=Streptomyces sp. NPDC006172 TaxID=3154470 RepID=UPI0033F830E2
MSDLGELDRPGPPASQGAWDDRSQEWLAPKGEAFEAAAGDPPSEGMTPQDVAEPRPERHADDTGAAGDPPLSEPASESAPVSAPASASKHASASESAPAPAPRRSGGDPVKALMHRHRDLCRRAVDPLEIAAGLEAHGMTDRTAARFRHRDVFSLAAEMYARVPRDGDHPARTARTAAPRARSDWALLTLLPGALCAATVTALRLTDGQTRLCLATAGALAVLLALRAALCRGPLSPHRHTHSGSLGAAGWTCALLAYAALGDGLLSAAMNGGPDALPTGAAEGPWPLSFAPPLTLALACAPAAWSAHLLAVRARRRLEASHGLEEFTASVRPLLFGVFALFLCALTTLTGLCAKALGETADHARTLTLGTLLFLARLLVVHGSPRTPVLLLGVASAAETTAVATVFAGRLPGCDFLAVPVEALVAAWGPAGVPILTCGVAALTLLIHASRTLPRASAHARTDQLC